ncbi:divalent-cation tolerance protein CutA [Candidatus Woesearchaeota archaeon]|nr:divalent-cation tolerance protein CutA [Candidatus Woesearchaeota archaeon]
MKLLYVTYPSEEEARRIVRTLLEKRLIVCATFFPVKSMYRWKGDICDGVEFVSLIKTTKAEAAKRMIEELHSYDVPCVIEIDAETTQGYLKYMVDELD